MFEHARKVEVIKRLEEKLGLKLWLHKDTRIKGEVLLEKGSGRPVFVFDGESETDVDYVVSLVSAVEGVG
jgi:hypothetical protein